MALWDPSQLSSTRFRLGLRAMDTAGANAGAEITQSGGAVSQWNDWSGNANHVSQATGANQPVYSASVAALGSKPGVTFDGANDYLSKAALNFSGQTIHVFTVLRHDGYGGAVFEISAGAFVPHQELGKFSSDWRAVGVGGGNAAYFNDEFVNRQLVSAEIGASRKELFFDGVSVAVNTGTTTAQSASLLWIGAESWAGRYAPMKLGEIVVIQGTLTQAERESIEGYLAWKWWGATNTLPSGHPYKAAAPTTGGGAPVDVTGTLSVTETGSDTAAISGSVAAPAVTGTLAATETGSDTAAISGSIKVTGTLSATESGSDTAAISGAISAPGVSGTLSATESGSDTAAIAGSVAISGSLAATESGSDTSAIAGAIGVSGALAATEAGADSAAIAGAISAAGVAGVLSATETGTDAAAIAGSVAATPITGALAATESGSDTAAIAGSVVGGIAGSLSATETGADTAALAGAIRVSGTLAALEAGNDNAAVVGISSPPLSGTLSAIETGSDLASILGFLGNQRRATAMTARLAAPSRPSSLSRARRHGS
jgi:hypothetical protein